MCLLVVNSVSERGKQRPDGHLEEGTAEGGNSMGVRGTR